MTHFELYNFMEPLNGVIIEFSQMSKIMKIYRRVKITRKTLFWSYFWLETLFRMRNSHFFKLDNRKKRKNAKFTHENGFSSQKYVSSVIFTLRLIFRIFGIRENSILTNKFEFYEIFYIFKISYQEVYIFLVRLALVLRYTILCST